MSTPFVLVTATTSTLLGPSSVAIEEAYTDAIVAAGLIPIVLPPMSAALAVSALDGVAGLVLTGGEDIGPSHYGQEPHPASGKPHNTRDVCELALAQAARARGLPTLALCRGAQIVNVAFGGTLVQDISGEHPHSEERIHPVDIDANSRLATIVGETHIVANSTHHQAIDNLAPGFRIVGRGPHGVVEAIEPNDSAWWMVAVQWHPETLTNTPEDWDRRIFSAFAEQIRTAN